MKINHLHYLFSVQSAFVRLVIVWICFAFLSFPALAQNQPNDDDEPSKSSKMSTSLVGTGWSVEVINRGEDLRKGGGVVQTFLFCKSGYFDNVTYRGPGALRGSYKISGNVLTLYDESGKMRGRYKIIWHPDRKMVDLDGGGKTIFRLFDGQGTDC